MIWSGCKAFGLMAVALVCCGTVQAQTTRQITIGLSSSSLGTAGVRVANELGLFAAHGIAAKFVIMDSASGTMTALISKSLEVVIAGPSELVAAQGRGQAVVAIATTYGGFGPSLVLSKAAAQKVGVAPDAPVPSRLGALDGMLIGSPSATSVATIAVRGSAKAEGANVRFTYMGQQVMPAALESGAIQGYIASAPYWAFPIIKGAGVPWLIGPKGDFLPNYTPAVTGQLQVLRSFAEAEPNLIRNLIAVTAELAHAIDTRPAEVKAVVGKLYPELDAATLDLLFASESIGWQAKPPTAEGMAHEIAVMKANGLALPEIDKVDPRAMVYP